MLCAWICAWISNHAMCMDFQPDGRRGRRDRGGDEEIEEEIEEIEEGTKRSSAYKPCAETMRITPAHPRTRNNISISIVVS